MMDALERRARRAAGEWVAGLTNWDWWVTLTFRRHVPDAVAQRALRIWLRMIAKCVVKQHVLYAIASDLQTGGFPHFHVLLDVEARTAECSPDVVHDLWRAAHPSAGFTRMAGYREEGPAPRLVVRAHGMNLHAATVVDGRDRSRLQHLCKYLLRPPFSVDAVHRLPDGRVRLDLPRKGRWVSMSPEQFRVRGSQAHTAPEPFVVRFADSKRSGPSSSPSFRHPTSTSSDTPGSSPTGITSARRSCPLPRPRSLTPHRTSFRSSTFRPRPDVQPNRATHPRSTPYECLAAVGRGSSPTSLRSTSPNALARAVAAGSRSYESCATLTRLHRSSTAPALRRGPHHPGSSRCCQADLRPIIPTVAAGRAVVACVLLVTYSLVFPIDRPNARLQTPLASQVRPGDDTRIALHRRCGLCANLKPHMKLLRRPASMWVSATQQGVGVSGAASARASSTSSRARATRNREFDVQGKLPK